MRKIIFLLITLLIIIFSNILVFAQDIKDFEIIPTWSGEKAKEIVNKITTSEKWVVQAYKDEAKTLSESCQNLGDARASGVFDWNLILCYFKYLIKFLSQVWLVIGALMIIYAWYLYASAVFAGSNPQKGATAVKNAILWIVIIISSYAILKILTNMFL